MKQTPFSWTPETVQVTGYNVDSSGEHDNAPTHLQLYCILKLLELSLAQFDYMLSAEM